MSVQMSHGQTFYIQNCPIGSHLKFFRGGHEKLQKTAFFAKIPSPQHFCVGKFFRDRSMRKLSSRGFRKCGTFGSCELFNGSYCCSKSTDFEISGLSPKISDVKKKNNTRSKIFFSSNPPERSFQIQFRRFSQEEIKYRFFLSACYFFYISF